MPTKTLQSGTIVKIEGKEYVVLEQKENDKYLVMAAKNVAEKVFQDHCTYRLNYPHRLRRKGILESLWLPETRVSPAYGIFL